jgi:hypothetical protein
MLGGFEAFHSTLLLAQNRDKYPEFRIPIVVLPATIRCRICESSTSAEKLLID